MKHSHIFFLLFLASVLLFACAASGQFQQAVSQIPTGQSMPTALLPAPTTALPAPPTPTPLPILVEAQLKNGSYQDVLFPEPLTLVDGRYQSGSGAEMLSVMLQPLIAYGDLNGDGLEDAALLLAENGGGSGVFVSLVAVLNQNGQPQQAGAVLVDDRPQIQSLAIQNGVILLGAVIQRSSDPMVSPTLVVSETFRLAAGGLHLVSLSTPTDGGLTRQITIASPAWGAETGASLQVSGEMPIGPFENNLLYRIVDAAGQEFAAGPFPVISDGIGGPASFDNALILPILPAGAVIWLELSENSMMDGSPLAVARVMLTYKP